MLILVHCQCDRFQFINSCIHSLTFIKKCASNVFKFLNQHLCGYKNKQDNFPAFQQPLVQKGRQQMYLSKRQQASNFGILRKGGAGRASESFSEQASGPCAVLASERQIDSIISLPYSIPASSFLLYISFFFSFYFDLSHFSQSSFSNPLLLTYLSVIHISLIPNPSIFGSLSSFFLGGGRGSLILRRLIVWGKICQKRFRYKIPIIKEMSPEDRIMYGRVTIVHNTVLHV